MAKQENNHPMTEAQRKAAVDLARQKVMAAFEKVPENYTEIIEDREDDHDDDEKVYDRTLSESREAPKISEAEWKRYHTAWQDYYKRYYEGYYSSALKKSQDQKHNSNEKKEEKQEKTAVNDLREKVRTNATESAMKFKKSRHFVPIITGLAVILIFVFLQYNRFFVATVKAYVKPASAVTEIVEIDPTVTLAISDDPVLIIPKINVEVPMIFNVKSDSQSQQDAMRKGVAHFAIPGANSVPGQIGNTVLSGHSSNDVFTQGDYKFIFAQLERMEIGDTIFANYEGVRYTYVITKKETVLPEDVGRLTYATDKPILTLVTCTPVGTSRFRLLVTAEQINPNPNQASIPEKESQGQSAAKTNMPGGAPTFWDGIVKFFTGRD